MFLPVYERTLVDKEPYCFVMWCFIFFIFIYRTFDWIATSCCEYVTFNQFILSVLQAIRVVFTYSLWQAICQRISFHAGARFEIDKVYHDSCTSFLTECTITLIISTTSKLLFKLIVIVYILPSIFEGHCSICYEFTVFVHLICRFLPAAYMSIFLISNTTESYLLVLWVSSYEPPLLHMTPVLFLVNKCKCPFPYCSIVLLYICSVICSELYLVSYSMQYRE